jgi:hypothetical protein
VHGGLEDPQRHPILVKDHPYYLVEWVEYEQQSKVMHEDVNRRREQYIKEQVASYKGAMVIDREVVKWDFNGVIPSYSVVEKIDKSAVLYGNFIFDIFLLILISKLN